MEPAETTSVSPVSTLGRESAELRARRLAAARRRATAVLAGVTVVFVAVTAAGVHGTLPGYVQAGAEAAMIGGVADWFAVTALFRRPLGLPIPHTALIVERKDQFAATLGQFVQENFLNADVLADRIRSTRIVPRLAAWLAGEANAAGLAGHYTELRELFEAESPRWVRDAVYRRVFDRLYTRLRHRLVAMAADPDDEARHQFEEWIAGLPDRLETSPELRERGERDVLGSPGLRDWSASLWKQAKDTLRTQAADPGSDLRRRLAGALAAAGRRLGSDRRLQNGLERVVESGARALADQFHGELSRRAAASWSTTPQAGQPFQISDELAFAAQRGELVVPVRSEVGEPGGRVGEQVSGDGEQGVADRHQGALLAAPPREPVVVAAAADHGQQTAGHSRIPPPTRRDRILSVRAGRTAPRTRSAD